MARKPRKTLQQQLADPGLRSKLPASKLTPVQRRQRKQNTRIAAQNANPLYNPLATLSGHALATAAKSIVDAQYGPTLSGLGRELSNTTTQGTALAQRSGDYYKQLAQSEADNIARQQAIGTLAQQQIGQAGDTGRANLTSLASDANAHVAADAAVRGPGLEGSNATAAADELNHAAGVQAQATAGAQSSAAGRAQDYASLENLLSQSSKMRGGEEQTRLLTALANQQAEIRAKTADTQAAKGGDYAKQLLTLRQQGFTNEATRQGLGLKGLSIATSAKNAAAGRAVTKRGQDLTRLTAAENAQLHQAALDERVRHDKQAEQIAAAKKAAGGAKEPASALTIRKSVGSITGWISEIRSRPGNQNLSRKNLADQLRKYVANRKLGSVPDYTLGPALDLVLDGHISPRNRQILQSYGVDVEALAPYAQKPKRRPKPSLLQRASGG